MPETNLTKSLRNHYRVLTRRLPRLSIIEGISCSEREQVVSAQTMGNGEVFDGFEVLTNHRMLVVDRSGASVSQRQSSKVVEILQQSFFAAVF